MCAPPRLVRGLLSRYRSGITSSDATSPENCSNNGSVVNTASDVSAMDSMVCDAAVSVENPGNHAVDDLAATRPTVGDAAHEPSDDGQGETCANDEDEEMEGSGSKSWKQLSEDQLEGSLLYRPFH